MKDNAIQYSKKIIYPGRLNAPIFDTISKSNNLTIIILHRTFSVAKNFRFGLEFFIQFMFYQLKHISFVIETVWYEN